MATKTPSLLIPNFKDRQQEAFAKSIKAVLDHLTTTTVNTPGVNSAANVAALQAEIAAILKELAALQAEINALGVTYTATQNIVEGQVVYSPQEGLASLADNTDAGTTLDVIGIASASVSTGNTFTVVGFGDAYTNTNWALTPGLVYLSAGGGITQSLPSTGQKFIVGYAVSATTVVVTPRPYSIQEAEQVFDHVLSGTPVTVPATTQGLSPIGEGLTLDDALTLNNEMILMAPTNQSIPSYSKIVSNLGVYIPSSLNMLVSSAVGLVNDGTIINDGAMVGV